MNKKILMSFLLVALVALSLSAVSAADADDVVAADDAADVIEADDASEVLSATYSPTANTSDAVQTAVDSAGTAGDVVDLSVFETYDFAGATVNVNKNNILIKGNGDTTIKGYGNGDGLFYITGSNVTVQGIKFVDTNPENNLTYNGTVSGIAVKFMNVESAVVQNCAFTDFNQGIRVQRSANVVIQDNEFNGGMATKLVNDPTVNKEQGTKAVNIMGSSNITVVHNIFDGPMLDGVSIASGSGDSSITDNLFVGNAYAIYFGGASTAGCLIAGNVFSNCGAFYQGDINWEGFPVVSIQKSSDNIAFIDNTFEANPNSILIAAEAGNTAHGGETEIGNVTVVHNTVKAFGTSDISNVTLFDVLVRDAAVLNLTAPLNVTENTFEGNARGVVIHFNDTVIFSAANAYLNETLDANHLYGPATLYGTTLTINAVNGYALDKITYTVTLKDSNGVGLYNKEVLIFFNDNFIKAYTDSNGVATLTFIENAATTKYVSAAFLGEGNMYSGSYDSATIKVNKKATTLTAKKATLKAKKAKKIKVTLKTGKTLLKGKKVSITVKGKTFKATTNSKGVATIKVKVAKKGKYTATVKFAGDGAYNAVTKKIKLTVKK